MELYTQARMEAGLSGHALGQGIFKKSLLTVFV